MCVWNMECLKQLILLNPFISFTCYSLWVWKREDSGLSLAKLIVCNVIQECALDLDLEGELFPRPMCCHILMDDRDNCSLVFCQGFSSFDFVIDAG